MPRSTIGPAFSSESKRRNSVEIMGFRLEYPLYCWYASATRCEEKGEEDAIMENHRANVACLMEHIRRNW